jgi:hypothetical protein
VQERYDRQTIYGGKQTKTINSVKKRWQTTIIQCGKQTKTDERKMTDKYFMEKGEKDSISRYTVER